MKHLALTLLALLCAAATFAKEITFDASTDTNGSSSAGAETLTKDGVTLSVSNGYLGTSSQYRIYKNATLTITSTVGEITSIVFTCTAQNTSQYGPGCLTANTGKYKYSSYTGTWTGSATEIVFTASTNQVRATSIVVTVPDDEVTVSTPTITPSSGTYYEAQTVTLAADDGATIYYSIDDADYQEYTTPLTVTTTSTIDAYATIDGETSNTASATLTIAPTYTTCQELRDNCTTTKTDVLYSFEELTVTGVLNAYVFVADGNASFLLFGYDSGLTKGDVISGYITGVLYSYNGLSELVVSDWEAVSITSSDNTVTPTNATIADILADYATYEEMYVRLEGVTFGAEAVESKYLAMTQDDSTLNIYDTGSLLTAETYSTTATYDVLCYVVSYNSTVQVYVLDPADITKNTTAIGALDATPVSTPTYNLLGQRVSGSYRGIVVSGGRKKVQR